MPAELGHISNSSITKVSRYTMSKAMQNMSPSWMQEPDACLEDVEDIDASISLEIEEGKKSLLLMGVEEIGGKAHYGSFFFVVNVDFYSGEGTKIGAQQIHVLKMRAGVRRVHQDFLAIDLNGKLGWNRVGFKQLVACLESIISGYK